MRFALAICLGAIAVEAAPYRQPGSTAASASPEGGAVAIAGTSATPEGEPVAVATASTGTSQAEVKEVAPIVDPNSVEHAKVEPKDGLKEFHQSGMKGAATVLLGLSALAPKAAAAAILHPPAAIPLFGVPAAAGYVGGAAGPFFRQLGESREEREENRKQAEKIQAAGVKEGSPFPTHSDPAGHAQNPDAAVVAAAGTAGVAAAATTNAQSGELPPLVAEGELSEEDIEEYNKTGQFSDEEDQEAAEEQWAKYQQAEEQTASATSAPGAAVAAVETPDGEKIVDTAGPGEVAVARTQTPEGEEVIAAAAPEPSTEDVTSEPPNVAQQPAPQVITTGSAPEIHINLRPQAPAT